AGTIEARDIARFRIEESRAGRVRPGNENDADCCEQKQRQERHRKPGAISEFAITFDQQRSAHLYVSPCPPQRISFVSHRIAEIGYVCAQPRVAMWLNCDNPLT